jgi:hypothetical protein
MKSLTLYEKIANPLAAIDSLGKWICDSGKMFESLTPAQGKMIAWYCMSNKVDPFTFKRDNHISSNGEIIPKTNAATARFIDAGGDIVWKSGLMDRQKAEAVFVWKGRQYGPWRITAEDARVDSHLQKYDWKTSPSGKKFKQYKNEYQIKETWRKDMPGMLRMSLKRKAITMLAPELLCPQRMDSMPEPPKLPADAEIHTEPIEDNVQPPHPDEILKQIERHFGKNMLPVLDKYAAKRGWVFEGEPFAAIDPDKLREIWQYSELFETRIREFAEELRNEEKNG